MKVCLGLHDFSVVNNRLDLLLKLKDRFPGFKVSLFTVPVDEKRDWGPWLIRDDFLKQIKYHLDWMQIIPHGFRHAGSEIRNCDYGEFKRLMTAIGEAFDLDGLPYEKGFCAPHWQWSDGAVKALDEAGWWGAVDPRQPMLFTKRFFRHSHSLDTLFSGDIEVLKLYGHIYGTRNDLGRCMWNLFNVPASAEWCFVTDFLEEG